MAEYRITVDGEEWNAISDKAEYDAIHAVAGAMLAGADKIEVDKVEDRL